MTDINDIKRELEALTAKVAAYEAEKATKRNWPERIEAGMVFRHEPTQMMILWTHERMEDCVVLERGGGIGDAVKKEYLRVDRNCEYLGHARDILTIRTDAHEPTGAELVGREVEVTNVPSDREWATSFRGKPIVCTDYQPSHACPYKLGDAGNVMFARLAK